MASILSHTQIKIRTVKRNVGSPFRAMIKSESVAHHEGVYMDVKDRPQQPDTG